MKISFSAISLFTSHLLGSLANEIKTVINSDSFIIPSKTSFDKIQSPAIFLDDYSHFTQCPALENLVKTDAYCFNAVSAPVNTAFTDKVNHMIKEHPERIIYKDQAKDFIIYHSKHGSTVCSPHAAFLKNICPKDRYDDAPNINIKMVPNEDGDDDIVCRHLTYFFLGQGKDYHRILSSSANIKNIDALMNNRFDHEEISYKANAYHYFSSGLFGKSLSNLCRQMQPGDVKTLILQTSRDNDVDHAMALKVTYKKTGMIVVKFIIMLSGLPIDELY